ncbi:tetratricopeptide repeat protein [Acidovorax sp.]|uniref:tetratricopeptide repeat protein n=1 Tax=Acidovorax sp. TaxID=1872122 RepID=UPI002ACE1486|nr:tetratricopeptide repeat protein [Acidovorax sp.]MDZ7867204.1 tetratricopeptide repeat protein [Acidovorax sp.]
MAFTDSAQEFARRFNPLRDTVYDAEAMFSGSAMSADLAALRPLAEGLGAESSELAQLLWLQFIVYSKRQMDDEGLPLGLRALAIRSALSDLTPTDRYEQHYAIGESALQSEEYDTAIEHLRQSAHWADHEGATLSAEQKLGIREEIGYALHEAGRFAEALAHNQQLLADARRAFGSDVDARLSGLINNLAQNAYELGDLAQAQRHLQQRLALGQALKDDGIVLDTLFQLGVLAHEAGDSALARSLLQQRVAMAHASGDEDLLEEAQATLAELAEREQPQP